MLYQLSRKAYNNLYTSSRGYAIGNQLQFANSKIEKRFLKGCYISNLQSIIRFHALELILSILDCLNERQHTFLTLIQIILTVIFLLLIKRAQSVAYLQIMSLFLQIYFFIRFTEMQMPYEFYTLLFTVWGYYHNVSWQSMTFFFAILFYSLSQIFENQQSFLWHFFFSQKRTIQTLQVELFVGEQSFRISEIEIEYTIFSLILFYFCAQNVRQNWKILDQTKRSERAYVNLFLQNTTPTFIINHQGNILELNEISKEIFGERRISYTSCSFFKLVQDKKELKSIKNAFEQVTLTKETVNVRANITIYKDSSMNSKEDRNSFISTGVNGIGGGIIEDTQQVKATNQSKSTLNSQQTGNTTLINAEPNNSNSNTRNGLPLNRRSNEGSVAPSPQMPSLNAKSKSIASPPVRHIVQIAPPLAKNTIVTKIAYPFLPEQFDDLLKDEYLNITDHVSTTKYYLVTISPFIWKETTSFLINLVDISETQDFIRISNFFMKNLNERLVSVLSHTEEDYQKWGNLAQLNQIKQTDLRELSAVISEQHSILSLTSLLRQLNQMYIGQEVGKLQDFQITNLIIQTIEVHSVRVQNYLKRIQLVFESFPPQANGDPTAFYFVNPFKNLQRYLDKSSSLVLSFEFDFAATQDQIEFFTRITKQFEDKKRCLIQSDLMGHDILETLYLMTLNSIKQNDGQVHVEQVDVSKKGEFNQQNQPQSSQNIAAPSSQQIITKEPIQNKSDNSDKSKEKQTPRFKVVLQQIFNTAEMHTVVKRQGEKSIMDSPAVAPSLDKKGGGRKYHALTKPPQINLSYTRFKEKLKETYIWKQCKEEDKKLQAQNGISSIMRRPDIQKVRNFQNFGIDSDESIPQPLQRIDGISPLPAKPNMRKASTHILNLAEELKQSQSSQQQQSQQQQQQQQQINQNGSISSSVNQQSQNQNIQQGGQGSCCSSTLINQTIAVSQKESAQQQNSAHNIQVNQAQQLPKLNSSGHINAKKNLENISEIDEKQDKFNANQKSNQIKQKTDTDSTDLHSDMQDFLSEDANSVAMSNNLKNEIKTYLKIYNTNIIKDLSKIVKNVLYTSKIQEDFDLKFTEKSSDCLSGLSYNIAQFCSPQLQSAKQQNRYHCKPSPIVHSAFQNYVNADKIDHKIELTKPQSSIKKDNEETPKSVQNSTRHSKTSFPSLIINSPLVVNNFRFRGETKCESSKDPSQTGKASNKKENKLIPWNQVFCWEVHQSRSQKHIRKWVLQDIWNKLYKKTDTVLVVSADMSDQSVMNQVFQKKKDLGRELEFVKINSSFEKYMGYLRDSQVFKYILIDLRLNLIEIGQFIQAVKEQESQSTVIPKAHFVGFNSLEHCIYNLQLDFIIVGEVEVLKLTDFIKILKDKN